MNRPLTAHQKFELTPQSAIIRSDKPNKGIEAHASSNPNVMHYLVGYLPDGTKARVVQRHGKGGMDFNKIVGGKVFAVAADGFSPVFEKGADKKLSTVQKVEDGLPVFSASGFYLLSSKDYPALDMQSAYVLLQNKGARALVLSQEQLDARQELLLESEFDLELLDVGLADALSDDRNVFLPFDGDMDKKRQRSITRTKEEFEDTQEEYEGVEFAPCVANQKSGSPFVLLVWSTATKRGHAAVLREQDGLDEDGRLRPMYFSPTEAVAYFKTTKEGRALLAATESGGTVAVAYVQGHSVRTSVSFRRKAENTLDEPTGKAQYGDAVFIQGAIRGWCKGIVAYLHSQHPNFPYADYDTHNYVVAPRQAEIGMTRKPVGQDGWLPPVAVHYGIGSWLLMGLSAADAQTA
jgi:hypothetical protein